MSEASDKAKAAADRIVGVTESLLAAVQKAAADLQAAIANGASAADPAFQAIADELNGEADKATAVFQAIADELNGEADKATAVLNPPAAEPTA